VKNHDSTPKNLLFSKGLLVANANKLNSTVYFFFGVFLGLTALVFFGDLVAFFAGLALVSLLQPVSWGTNIFGVFRVKNHNFTPKNNIFSNCGGRQENCWCISCEKSQFTKCK
jgi:hypothetical protein